MSTDAIVILAHLWGIAVGLFIAWVVMGFRR